MKTNFSPLSGTLRILLILLTLIAGSCNQHTSLKTASTVSDLADTQRKAAIQLPKEATNSWWQDVQKDIKEEEYHVSWQKDKQAFQSPNRKNNLRGIFKPNHLQLIQRDSAGSEVHFTLLNISADGKVAFIPKRNAKSTSHKNKIEFNHGAFAVQYENSEEGIRQNVVVNRPVAAKQLQVNLELNSQVQVIQVHPQELHIVKETEKGVEKLLTYNSLKAWDKNGKELPAHFKTNGQQISWVVDAENAVYPVTIDPLSSSPNWTVEGNQAFTNLGWSVSSAGDVNGDGYSDVIVGAPNFDNGESNEGRAYVFHGSASGLSATANWAVESNQAGAKFGYSVATAGDVNGDGYSDVIVGAYFYSNIETYEGKAFVYHGSATGLNTSDSWTAESNQASAYFGISVNTAGDVNGDGYSDVIIGGYAFDNGQGDEGRAFVYHGSSSGLSATVNWTAESDQTGANFGISVASAGDVNGDGYSDVIIGAYLFDNGQTNEGRAFVYNGSSAGLNSAAAWTAESDQADANFGFSVSSAGDVNGDGYSDVIVGAYAFQSSGGQADEGKAYVYHGSSIGLSSTANWSAESNLKNAFLGYSVACAGDVNGDGYSDVIVGSYAFENGQTTEGRIFVFHGSSTGLAATANWTAESDIAGAQLGWFVASAGDVNGDGFSDVIAGAPNYSNGETFEGRVYVYQGAATGLDATSAWTVESNQANAFMGCSLGSAGDVNGDGYSDVIVGAHGFDNDQSNEGRAFVYHGSATGLSTTANWTAEGNQTGAAFGGSVASAGDVNGDGYSDVIVGAYSYDNGESNEGRVMVFHGSVSGLNSTPNWTAESNQASAYFGNSVSTAGDVNADGYSDVIIGSYYYNGGQAYEGKAFVYHGSSTGLAATPNWTAESNQGSAYFGWSVASAGDVNGDGYMDVIVGAYYYTNDQGNEGRAFVYHGSSSGLSSTASWTAEGNLAGAYFGNSVAGAGDVNGDGYGDVIIGSYYYANGETGEGRAFVFHGSSAGLNTTANWTAEINQTYAGFGYSVASAGDVNGDGYSEVIVGACWYDNGQTDEGAAFLYLGSSTGLSSSVNWTTESNQTNAFFYVAVASAGDVNGDGYGDLLIGGSWFDNGQADEGKVWMYYGNNLPGFHNNLVLYDINLSSPISASNLPESQFGAGLFAKSFIGRGKGKLVWETRGNGSAFSSTPITYSTQYTAQQAAYTDLGLSGTSLKNLATKSLSQIQTRIRARVRYNPATAITGQVYGPWHYTTTSALALSSMLLKENNMSFIARLSEDNVQLRWTEADKDSRNFIIERSCNGQRFDSIGIVSASEYNINGYTFTDHTPLKGRNTYRLRQLNSNGKISYSTLRTILIEGSFAASLYPNPVNESSSLRITSSKNEIMQLQLFNTAGKLVWKQEVTVYAGSHQVQLPVTSLKSGSYLLFVSSTSGHNVLRFVK